MRPVKPILAVELFPLISAALVSLLKSLPSTDWERPTTCAQWTVKDIVAHLLGGNIGRLIVQRDQFVRSATGASYEALFNAMEPLLHRQTHKTNYCDLVELINSFNAEWVKLTNRYHPTQLVELLEQTDLYLYQLFKTLPANQLTGTPVAWAGESQSTNWFDIAREYTEKWLHQQHIRQVVDKPGLMERRWLFPVLDTFMRALPYAYRNREASEGTLISFNLVGEAGGNWSLLRENARWVLLSGISSNAICLVQLDQDLAWRLFSKGVSSEVVQSRIQLQGDRTFSSEFLKMVSIMA